MNKNFFKLYHFKQHNRALLFLIIGALLALSSQITAPGRAHHRSYQSNYHRNHYRNQQPDYQNPTHTTSRPQNKSPHTPRPLFRPDFFKLWRERFLTSIEPYDDLGLIAGFFLGDLQRASADTKDQYRDAGLSHLTAASGFNCWIVAISFSYLFLGALALTQRYVAVPALWFLKLRIYAPPLFSLFGAVLFWLWSDQSPPITRSTIMISLKIFLEALHWRTSFQRILISLYLLALLLMPTLFRNVSFQLSFGCLIGLAYTAKPLNAAFEKHLRNILITELLSKRARQRRSTIIDLLSGYLANNIAAILGTIPATVLVFHQINFNGLIFNWFAIPMVSIVVMPLGLLHMALCVPLNIVNEHLTTEIDLIKLSAATAIRLAAWACYWLTKFIEIGLDWLPNLKITFDAK